VWSPEVHTVLQGCVACQAGSPNVKALMTLQARFALLGWTLNVGADGMLLAGRWGRPRELQDLEEAERFLCVLEGPGAVADRRSAHGGR